MDFELEGFEELFNSVDNCIDNFDRETGKSIVRLGNKFVGKLKLRTPVDTGALRRSWAFKKNSDTEGEVFNNVKYGMYVNYGHRTRGGGFVEGNYMVERSAQEMEQEFGDEIEIIIENLWKD